MPATEVLTEDDDGRRYIADVLGQYRDRGDGQWRVVVTYSTEPGSRYIRAEPADRCRAVDDEAPGWVDPRQDGRTRPAQKVTPADPGSRDAQPPWW